MCPKVRGVEQMEQRLFFFFKKVAVLAGWDGMENQSINYNTHDTTQWAMATTHERGQIFLMLSFDCDLAWLGFLILLLLSSPPPFYLRTVHTCSLSPSLSPFLTFSPFSADHPCLLFLLLALALAHTRVSYG
ncbi:hypothetical protein HDK77DRAFT_120408 [Phyllosticta capitalensis]